METTEAELSTTTTKEKLREQMGNEGMNIEEIWHGSEKSSIQVRMTDFSAESENARQLDQNT